MKILKAIKRVRNIRECADYLPGVHSHVYSQMYFGGPANYLGTDFTKYDHPFIFIGPEVDMDHFLSRISVHYRTYDSLYRKMLDVNLIATDIIVLEKLNRKLQVKYKEEKIYFTYYMVNKADHTVHFNYTVDDKHKFEFNPSTIFTEHVMVNGNFKIHRGHIDTP